MQRAQALAMVGLTLAFALLPALTSHAQLCSVRAIVTGECTDSLILTLHVGSDLPLEGILIEVGGGFPSPGPILVSRIEPLSSSPGLSSLNVQRLFNTNVSGGTIEPSLRWDFGSVAQLEARLQDIDALLRALLENFFKSQDLTEPAPERELTLRFNLDSPGFFLPAQLESQSSFGLDERLRLYLSRATVTLRMAVGSGNLTGEIELDPKDLDISKEKISLELSLGPALLSGETTFERGVGLTSQVYLIRAQVGTVQLIGQATFTSTSQEFKIGASIAGLALSGSSLITTSGLTQQSIFIEIPIGSRK